MQMFYNRVLERLIEHSRSLPPNLILHEFAINAVHITEQVKQFQSFGLIFVFVGFCHRPLKEVYGFCLEGKILAPHRGRILFFLFLPATASSLLHLTAMINQLCRLGTEIGF